MSNYFYHPLGDEYASKYLAGQLNTSESPHTRINHGLNKVDFGCGGGLPVYSMTNGTLVTYKWCGGDGVSKYGAVVKTTETGYSKMMAQRLGGTAEDYPLFFTYIEMNSLMSNLHVGDYVEKGTQLGVTNSEYAGSNLHFDIQPYDRYGGDNGTTAEHWYGAISLWRKDAYGDKGTDYNLKDYLDPSFSLDSDGNIIDSTGNHIGVKSGKIYYPPNSSGGAVTYNTEFAQMTAADIEYIGGNSMAINRWYSFPILMQKPIYVSGSQNKSDNSLKIQCDEWGYQLLLGLVQAECSWTNLAVAQMILCCVRNWIYLDSYSNDEPQSLVKTLKNNKTINTLLTAWNGGNLESYWLSLSNSSPSTVEGVAPIDVIQKIMDGEHLPYAEQWKGKNKDGTYGLQFFNGATVKDLEDVTGFPPRNSSNSNNMAVVWFKDIFQGWGFHNGAAAKALTKPSVLLGL